MLYAVNLVKYNHNNLLTNIHALLKLKYNYHRSIKPALNLLNENSINYFEEPFDILYLYNKYVYLILIVFVSLLLHNYIS